MKKSIKIGLYLLFIATNAFAQVVEIPDLNLREAIRETLQLPAASPITQQDIEKLEYLDNEKTEKMGITDLTGLEYATNLNSIPLNQNEITDLSPLSNLIQLEALAAWGNPIADISPLAKLTNLTYIDLSGCDIADITPLSNLTELENLNIGWNLIPDISPLSNLTNLKYLTLTGNKITDINPLSNLTQLERLAIDGNRIIDLSPLDELSLTVLYYDEACELPSLPIKERLQNRTFPSVFSAFGHPNYNHVKNLPGLSSEQKFALHDLNWHIPYFGISFGETPQGWKLEGFIERSQQIRDTLLNLNPNMLFFAEVRVRDDFLSRNGEDWSHWLRDSDGDLIRDTGSKSDIYLIDFTRPATQDMIVQQAIAVAQCGLFDGIFLDRFVEYNYGLYDDSVYPHKIFYSLEEEQYAKDNILQRIRAAVRDDFLILVNTNREKSPRRAWGVNGTFMETLRDTWWGLPVIAGDHYGYEGLKHIESTLLWAEENLREPQINCLEGFHIRTEPLDSPDNLRWMRVFTTMSLTHSDGYVLYGRGMWYDFWDADLGRPIGSKAQQYQKVEGLFIREFTHGWAVYNRSGKTQAITLPRISTGVSSNKQDIIHLLPDLDGEIYLRKGKSYDLNRDGTVNVLDLILVSQHFGTAAGDVNGDGTTDILDLTLVAQRFN